MKCSECETELTPEALKHALDPYTPDHKGLCCDCFDVSMGANRTIKLKQRTPYRVHDFDDYDCDCCCYDCCSH